MSPKAVNDREDPTRARLQRAERSASEAELKARALAQAAAHLAGEKKATDVRILDVVGVCDYADYFVIASAPSERQSSAIAKTIDDSLRTGGVKPISTEGLRQGNWALLDFGDVVVHVFLDSARDYYDLEGFWADGTTLPVEEEQGIAALRELGLTPQGELLPEGRPEARD